MSAVPGVEPGGRTLDIAGAAQLACLLEVLAPKPGNVSPGRRFGDMGIEHFLASAVAIGEPLRHASSRPLGATIRDAVRATSSWTRRNTNLGIVLLLVPLARAASLMRANGEPQDDSCALALRQSLAAVLAATSIDDARSVYAAIRQAAPGGLGQPPEQDVAGEPTLSLLEVMRLAAHRDDIAREYVTSFTCTFDTGAPSLQRARQDGLSWDDAIVETFLTLLAARPDTHVARRAGPAAAEDVSRRAAAALAAGGVRTDAGRRTIEETDRALRARDNLLSPGTTADLTAAAIFVVLLDGGWDGGR